MSQVQPLSQTVPSAAKSILIGLCPLSKSAPSVRDRCSKNGLNRSAMSRGFDSQTVRTMLAYRMNSAYSTARRTVAPRIDQVPLRQRIAAGVQWASNPFQSCDRLALRSSAAYDACRLTRTSGDTWNWQTSVQSVEQILRTTSVGGAPFSPFALASSLRRRDVRAQEFTFVPHQLAVIAAPGLIESSRLRW